jgi:chromosome segregation ATPase
MINLEDMLKLILSKLTSIEDRMMGLEDRMMGLEDRMTGLEDRMMGLEDRMTGLEAKQEELKEIVVSLRSGQEYLIAKVDSMDLRLAAVEGQLKADQVQLKEHDQLIDVLAIRTTKLEASVKANAS